MVHTAVPSLFIKVFPGKCLEKIVRIIGNNDRVKGHEVRT